MRFMLLMIPGGYENAPAGDLPDAEGVEKMMSSTARSRSRRHPV
jgi:hypothetical protein